MEFQFAAHKGFHFATAFAAFLEVPAKDGYINLPAAVGEGFIQEVYLDNGLFLCIHQYRLRQPLVLRRLEADISEILTLKFDGVHPSFVGDRGYAVEIGTSNLFTELKLGAGQTVNFLVVTTTRQTLLDMLHLDTPHHPLKGLLMDNQSFLFHEDLTPDMDKALKQLGEINETTRLAHLLYQTKTQELIYHLFNKLLDRTISPATSIHQIDAQKIYEVRAGILRDLGEPPHLPDLARRIGMSETKMKHLFRQIFGDSIYNYYQTARMDAAASLLKKLSVSETGYQLGFTNMSHFTRLFEKHHRVKPKKFKDTISL